MSPLSKSALPDDGPLNTWVLAHRGHRVARLERMDHAPGRRYFTLICWDCEERYVYDGAEASCTPEIHAFLRGQPVCACGQVRAVISPP